MTTNTTTAEDRLAKLGIHLPDAPTPFGAYVPAVQTGNLLFLSGMLATSGHTATVVGIVGKDLDVKAGREAAYTAALNVLALTKKQLGSLEPREPRREARRVRRRDAGVHRAPEGRRCGVGVASRCLRRRDRLFAPCLWCREPSTRFAGRTGSHPGSEALIQPATRNVPEGTKMSHKTTAMWANTRVSERLGVTYAKEPVMEVLLGVARKTISTYVDQI